MLFGDGRSDMAHFAADRPLAEAPGTRFNYSSATSNIVSGIVARTVGPGEPYARFLHGRLFAPLGMASADPEFDEAGTWAASSFLRATARDFARFGLFYLRDGVWDGVRLLPAGWVDHGRTLVSVDRGRPALRRALVGPGRRQPARDVPRRGLRGAVHLHLPAARPRRGAARPHARRAVGQPHSLACRHGRGVRRLPAEPAASRWVPLPSPVR